MKKFFTLIVFLAPIVHLNTALSQNVIMSNGSFSKCGDSVLDPGGIANYMNNTVTTTTICPLVTGAFIRLNFSSFDTETLFDNLVIHNGNSTAGAILGTYSGSLSPFNVQSSDPSGCLTLVFTTDAVNTFAGFQAAIQCIFPCQTVISEAQTTTPAAIGGFIDLCLGDVLIVNGNAQYPTVPQVYPQSNATSTFRWNFGDLTVSNTQNASHTYASPGVYDLNLNVTDINGCQNTNDINLKVRVSGTPTFVGSTANASTICLGQSNVISGFAQPLDLELFCESSVGQTVVIPDGVGVPYSSDVDLNCFNPGALVTNASDIVSVCLDIEHSYVHDLIITLTCPNGSSVDLYSAPPGSINDVQLGEPVDNDLSSTIGDPYTYCFTPNATNTWFNIAEPVVGLPPTHNYTDNDGTVLTNVSYIPPGNYLPINSFNALIGCPLNGDWTLTITDQLAMDNGVVFSWGIDFIPSLYSTVNNFTPSIALAWVADPTITANAGNTITVTPIVAGNACYTFQATDQFNCVYDTLICFTVTPADDATFSYAQPTYCTNNPNPIPTISGTTGGIFTATNGLPISPTTGSIDLANSVVGSYTITYTTAGVACPASSSVTIVINNALASFTATNVSGCGPLTVVFTNTSPNSVNCAWNFGNGQTSTGCGTVTHTYNNSGNYSPQLVITDINGCIATSIQSNLVSVGSRPVALFTPTPSELDINNQVSVMQNNSVGATTFAWVFQDNTSSTQTSPAKTFNLADGEESIIKLFAFSASGCVDSTERIVRVKQDLIFYAPNSFTPNNDEFNSTFLPIMTQGFEASSYNLRIFDRWGNLVFQSKNPSNGWDGTVNNSGRIVPDGMYIYQIDYLLSVSDERQIYHGHVNLIR